jgi:uncharacterized membrane protein
MRLFIPLLAAAAIAVTASGASAEPGYWRVSGVAPDDTLNVRAGPSGSAEDIGDLAHDATGIEVGAVDASGNWGRIPWQEGDGWISMQFLAPDPQPMVPGTSLPQGLLCAGTEPFWSVRLSGGGATYSDIGGAAESLSLMWVRSPEGRGQFPVMLTHRGASAGSIAVIEPVDCSDGMSDFTYPWRVLYLLSTPGGDRLLDGCCQLPLEAGSH